MIVWKLNRISRKLLDILNIVDLLNKHNIAFRSLTESFETETPSGKLQLNIMGAIGEFERETIAENVKLGLVARARDGRWCGGVVLGYDLVELPNQGKKRKNTILKINEVEANTVRRIFDLYSQGHGYKAVVNRINNEGRKTKRNSSFAVSTVKDILQNPVYIGKIRYNVRQDWSKKRRNNINANPILSDGIHEPIIDIETWNKVQVILKERSKKHNKIYDSEFPLTGILRCPVCGAGMTINRSTSKRKDGTRRINEYYSCGNWKNKGTAVCNSNSIRVEVADEYVLNKIMELINDETILRKVVDNINQNKSTKLKPILEQLEQINKEIEKLTSKKSKNIELYEDGILDKSELSIRVKVINDEIEKLKYREQELKQDLQLAVDNINQNKSTKLKPILEQLEQINKEIEKLTSKKSKNIELYEDGILDKSELSIRVKVINDEIEKLKYREQELKQDLQLAEGDPIPFELVNEVMQRFKEVLLEMSTSQQRKQLIHLLVSKITINKERDR